LRINGKRFKTLGINEVFRYLGYWGAEIVVMATTREVVREKARMARNLIKCHPLSPPELSAELFAQSRKEIGAFQFSAAVIE